MSDLEKGSGVDPEEEVEEETSRDPKTTMVPNLWEVLTETVAAEDEEDEEKPRFTQNQTLVPTTEDLAEVTRQQVMADVQRAKRKEQEEQGKRVYTLDELRQMSEEDDK